MRQFTLSATVYRMRQFTLALRRACAMSSMMSPPPGDARTQVLTASGTEQLPTCVPSCSTHSGLRAATGGQARAARRVGAGAAAPSGEHSDNLVTEVCV